MMPSQFKRPLITLKNGVIYHDDRPARVVLGRELLSVGCTDISIEAANFLLSRWRDVHVLECLVLQDGA